MCNRWHRILSSLGAQNVNGIRIITYKSLLSISEVVATPIATRKQQACTPATNVVGKRGNRTLLYFLISSVWLYLDLCLFPAFMLWKKRGR